MRKRFYLIIPAFICLSAFSIYFIAINNKKNEDIEKIDINTNSRKIICNLSGAVLEAQEIIVKQGITIRELLTKVVLSIDADISKLNLDQVLLKDCQIFVPFLDGSIAKLKWSEIENSTFLIKCGISKKIAEKIIEFKERFQEVPTWNDIDQIEGIGIKTLEKLKAVIILE